MRACVRKTHVAPDKLHTHSFPRVPFQLASGTLDMASCSLGSSSMSLRLLKNAISNGSTWHMRQASEAGRLHIGCEGEGVQERVCVCVCGLDCIYTGSGHTRDTTPTSLTSTTFLRMYTQARIHLQCHSLGTRLPCHSEAAKGTTRAVYCRQCSCPAAHCL